MDVGETHTISGLSVELDAGTYFVGSGVNMASGSMSSGSGDGSGDTVGDGMWHYLGAPFAPVSIHREDDHLAFKLEGASLVPLPSAAWLGLGLLGGLGVIRRTRRRRAA